MISLCVFSASFMLFVQGETGRACSISIFSCASSDSRIASAGNNGTPAGVAGVTEICGGALMTRNTCPKGMSEEGCPRRNQAEQRATGESRAIYDVPGLFTIGNLEWATGLMLPQFNPPPSAGSSMCMNAQASMFRCCRANASVITATRGSSMLEQPKMVCNMG